MPGRLLGGGIMLFRVRNDERERERVCARLGLFLVVV